MEVTDFNWALHPNAETLVKELLDKALYQSPQLAEFNRLLSETTSTQLLNWVDHVGGPVSVEQLQAAGFVDGYLTRTGIWRHPRAQLPAVFAGERYTVALRVDDAAAFAHAQHCTTGVEGSPRSGFRRAIVSTAGAEVTFAGVERRSWGCGVEPQVFSAAETLAATEAWRLWDERPRPFATGVGNSGEAVGAVGATMPVAQAMVELVGADLAAGYVLELERRYWQRRNTAGVLQHARQDRLGLGWGNNDHHTFRSSRAAFMALIQTFHAFGFVSRERFFAGEHAGWGAQILEHPGCGGVLFTDVDLAPDEIGMDFSTTQLPDLSSLGTVGLWCALHGESILGAGMHHLEGQFEFDELREDLAKLGIGQMKPFSNFPHLRQAFTEAEKWPVTPEQLTALISAGHIDQTKAAEFAERGAAGSHLENLQRRDGFKGFNQHSVSTTMKATDPRVYQPNTETHS